ncbi:MAG: DEAD/DEAH box helicase, partial [Sphingobacteriales bacterium]
MTRSFEDFKLNRQLLNAVEDAGYTIPTPIQEKAIGPVLSGQDIFGIAETGTGKTAAYVLPLLMQLKYAQGDAPRGLILAPTRELAMQIAENVTAFAKYTDLRTVVIYGGVGGKAQGDAIMKGCDLVIATPGRFLDLYLAGKFNTSFLRHLVLDEADKMM